MPTRASIPASTSSLMRAQPLARVRGRRLALAPDVVVERRDRERDRDVRAARRLLEHVDVADDHRPARDDRERVRRGREDLEARARQPVAALGRLVRVGRGADDDARAFPGRPRELAREHLGDVDLHADRAPVAVVRRPVGAALEGADVTERAPVRATHVRVERPLEHHPLDAVERAPAGLLAVLHLHAANSRTYVRTRR